MHFHPKTLKRYYLNELTTDKIYFSCHKIRSVFRVLRIYTFTFIKQSPKTYFLLMRFFLSSFASLRNSFLEYCTMVKFAEVKIKSTMHSMARANLNKSKKVLTSTTIVSKYIPKMSRICIN